MRDGTCQKEQTDLQGKEQYRKSLEEEKEGKNRGEKGDMMSMKSDLVA